MKNPALSNVALILFLLTIIPINDATSQAVLPDPINVVGYRGNNYSVYDFYITGTTSGTIWGCNLYTDDSYLSTAAVHAGYVANTCSKVVRVRILPGQSSYSACSQSSVTSLSYGVWSGSYEIFSSYDMIPPTVTTTNPIYLTGTSASSGGNVSSEGSTSVISRGVCWNTTGSPTISDSKTSDGSGSGTFSSTMTELAIGPLYYVRSYATNNCGITSYGEEYTLAISALPIELTSFEVYSCNNAITIEWSTATETNNDYFTVERSSDAINFTPIAVIKGAGNSNGIIDYEILDKNPVVSANYYRLKQTDFNGTYKYSETKSVHLNSTNNEIPIKFALYPNPAMQYINISSNQQKQQFQVWVYNQNGSIVGTFDLIGSKQLNISDLKPGAYHIILRDITNYKQFHLSFIKSRN